MSHRHGNNFENPSRLFLWSYSILSFFMSRKPYQKLLQELNLKGDEKILEFGSGVGSLAKKLATSLQNQGQLVCIDVSDKFLSRTKKKLKNYSNVKFLLGELANTDIPSNSFDYIITTWVLHHVKDTMLEPSIQKFYSVLKPDGKVFVIEFPDDKQKRHGFSQEKLLNIFTKNGFKKRVVFTTNNAILYEFSTLNQQST